MKNKIKEFIKEIGFTPKESEKNIYHLLINDYEISINTINQSIDYGDLILQEHNSSSNLTVPETQVVLECVIRLLKQGYKPENIILEKTWKSGHGTSGRLDICVLDDITKKEYMLIECKTYGKEYEKEYNNMMKNGGQLFTYFKFSNNADIIMLYSSSMINHKIIYKNDIVKIEDIYRIGDAKDFYEKWSKITKDNGIFENWCKPYGFVSKSLTESLLRDIQEKDSKFIFNRFLEILRNNVVSDKPNAFNKIFSLFLCKIFDEKDKEGMETELDFQWLEGIDNNTSFQLRLTDLYKEAMNEILNKQITDFSEQDFEEKYSLLDESVRKAILVELNKLRLEKNNEFAFVEVYDEKSFDYNARIVKEVVELLQGYRIRYSSKQQYLSDFFEALLTTGLKQEAGQYFTPVPIAQFILESLPIDELVYKKIKSGNRNDLLPYIIDNASGSGHFLTESMHHIQTIINTMNTDGLKTESKNLIKSWQISKFEWASKYVYGIEKDYRLVKVAKVGCYLHGDGIANVLHSDGLADFNNPEYFDMLSHKENNYDNSKFDIVVSNPPYSIPSFLGSSNNYYDEHNYELFEYLTESSSEIEVLFIERTKQLLNDGGIAGIILPSTILTNGGVYSKTRELILRYFKIIAISDFGQNTFMATTTKTVVLFLKRRSNSYFENISNKVSKSIEIMNDLNIDSIEKPISNYLDNIWGGINISVFSSFILKGEIDDDLLDTDLYNAYLDEFKEFNVSNLKSIYERELLKICIYISNFNNEIVYTTTGTGAIEKSFLGYEFSKRRGNSGIHPIERRKTIDECTRLFDSNSKLNPNAFSSFIYNKFTDKPNLEIPTDLKDNVRYESINNMIDYSSNKFGVSINVNKAVDFEIKTKWKKVKLSVLADLVRGVTYSKEDQVLNETSKTHKILTADNIDVFGNFSIKKVINIHPDAEPDEDKKLMKNDIFICLSSGSKNHLGKVSLIEEDTNYYAGGFMGIYRPKENTNVIYLYHFMNTILKDKIKLNASGSNINNLNSILSKWNIPLPPKEIQDEIVKEIKTIDSNLTLSSKEKNLQIYKVYTDYL